MDTQLRTLLAALKATDPDSPRWQEITDGLAPGLLLMTHARIRCNGAIPREARTEWHEAAPLAVVAFLRQKASRIEWRERFDPESPRSLGFVLTGIEFELKACVGREDDPATRRAAPLDAAGCVPGIDGNADWDAVARAEDDVEHAFVRRLAALLQRATASQRRQIRAFAGHVPGASRNDASYGRRRCFGLWLASESEVARRHRQDRLDDDELDIARHYGEALAETADFARAEALASQAVDDPAAVRRHADNLRAACGAVRPRWLDDVLGFLRGGLSPESET